MLVTSGYRDFQNAEKKPCCQSPRRMNFTKLDVFYPTFLQPRRDFIFNAAQDLIFNAARDLIWFSMPHKISSSMPCGILFFNAAWGCIFRDRTTKWVRYWYLFTYWISINIFFSVTVSLSDLKGCCTWRRLSWSCVSWKRESRLWCSVSRLSYSDSLSATLH